MEKSILQLSKESLTELSSLPHLKTEPKPEPKKREGTAGRIGPETLPKKTTGKRKRSKSEIKIKKVLGPRTIKKIKSVGKEALGAAGRSASDALVSRASEIGGNIVHKILGKGKPS